MNKPTSPHVGRKYQLREVKDQQAKVTSLIRKLEALETSKATTSVLVDTPSMCLVCAMQDHDIASCPVILGVREALHGQVKAVGQFQGGYQNQRSGNNPYSNTYNPVGRIALILGRNKRVLKNLNSSNNPHNTSKVIK